MAEEEDLRGKGCGTEVQGKVEVLDALAGCTGQPASMFIQRPQNGNLYHTVSLGLDQAGTQEISCGQRVWWMPGRLPRLRQNKLEKAQAQSGEALNWPWSLLYLQLENNCPY